MSVEININVQGHVQNTASSSLWLYAASEWHRLYRPYVPWKEGILYSSVKLSGGNCQACIEHYAPYAHYMYEGRVMGPNVPIMQGGEITSWISPQAPKHYTGAMIHYNGRGSAHWDQAAAPTQGPLLIQSIQNYVRTATI